MYFLVFILFEIHWASWICKYMPFPNLGKLSAIIFPKIFAPIFPLCHFKDSIKHVLLDLFTLSYQSLRLASFSKISFSTFSDWIISTDLSRSLTFIFSQSSVISSNGSFISGIVHLIIEFSFFPIPNIEFPFFQFLFFCQVFWSVHSSCAYFSLCPRTELQDLLILIYESYQGLSQLIAFSLKYKSHVSWFTCVCICVCLINVECILVIISGYFRLWILLCSSEEYLLFC